MKLKISISIIIVLLIIGILNCKVFANGPDITANIGETANLDKGTLGFYSIQKKNSEGNWVYITYSIIKYRDERGEEHVAYCLDEDKFGVGYVKDDVDGYAVKLTNFLSNEKVWRVIINGYPYKSPSELGVETDDDAYIATKRAVYAMVKGWTEQDILENYRVGQVPINGENLHDIQRRGEKIIQAVLRLVNIGNFGTETLNNELKLEKVGDFLEEGEFYYQEYKVNCNVDLSNYEVEEIVDFPNETKIVDTNGIEKKVFNMNENFFIKIPKREINDDIWGSIKVNAKCKTYPIYFGEAPDGYQNYAICSGYWNNLKAIEAFNQKTDLSKLTIKKIDEEDEIPLPNVKFELTNEDGEKIGEYTTDEKGEIVINNLKPSTVIIKETETLEGYEINEQELRVEIPFNEKIEIKVSNKRIPEEPPIEEPPIEEPPIEEPPIEEPPIEEPPIEETPIEEPPIEEPPIEEPPVEEPPIEKLPRTGEDYLKFLTIFLSNSCILISFISKLKLLK